MLERAKQRLFWAHFSYENRRKVRPGFSRRCRRSLKYPYPRFPYSHSEECAAPGHQVPVRPLPLSELGAFSPGINQCYPARHCLRSLLLTMLRAFCCTHLRLNEVLIELPTPYASGWGGKCALPATGRFFEGALPHNCIFIPRIVRIARTGANWCKPREPPSLVTPGQVLPLTPAADFCNKKRFLAPI